MHCFFASDLHGRLERYSALFQRIKADPPDGLFLGGDLLPHGMMPTHLPPGPAAVGFLEGFFFPSLRSLRNNLRARFPQVFLILGNDDPRFEEAAMLDAASEGLFQYAHERRLPFGEWTVAGYSFVPPTPFQLKDWERYDVSRYIDPGCVSPEEGRRTVPVSAQEARFSTIQKDLERLTDGLDSAHTLFLFHAPPYQTLIDRAALDGRTVEHVPLDVHVGSIAVRRALERLQPPLSLHGHVHEAARLTGSWRDKIGSTEILSAAHDGPELALVIFDPQHPTAARRELIG